MEENKIEEKKVKKLSYEELEVIARQLTEQNKKLFSKLQEANMFNALERLKYLFKVVKYASAFDPKFVKKCVEEIEDTVTLPEDTEAVPDESN